MNFTTALRQKWNPWFELIFFLPLPLLGFSAWTIYLAFGFNLIYQFAIHTEVVDRMWRPIEWVFNTPSHHRVHHGSRRRVPRCQLRRHPDRLGPHVPARSCPSGTGRRTG